MQYNRHGIGHEHIKDNNTNHIVSTVKRHKFEILGVIGLIIAFVLTLLH